MQACRVYLEARLRNGEGKRGEFQKPGNRTHRPEGESEVSFDGERERGKRLADAEDGV